MSYCLTASCLAHKREVFWQPPWSCWVHATGCQPCEALSGEGDPTGLRCRYCGVSTQADGAGRLWSLAGAGLGHWGRLENGLLRWQDECWTAKCPVSPTFHHEISGFGRKYLYASQAAG